MLVKKISPTTADVFASNDKGWNRIAKIHLKRGIVIKGHLSREALSRILNKVQ